VPFTVLIPARLASTRLPNKPLADIAGLPMVVHVARRAAQSNAQRVVVATDSVQVQVACTHHGVQVVMTDSHHESGSDRLAQACQVLGLHNEATVVNVQGDEPLIDPALINAVAEQLHAQAHAAMSTAACAIANWQEFQNPHVVKVVCNQGGDALLFSRSPIPHWRDQPMVLPNQPAALRHIGIYGYRASFLRLFPCLAPAPLERTEALEQLRALWHGHCISVYLAAHAPAPGVDTPEDLERVRLLLAN
jgi:3-deoxy-manno-octulosonate cytidylyltransferase (CMP-KDO synthetase)